MQQILISILPIFLLIMIGVCVQKITDALHPVRSFFDRIGLPLQHGWTYVLNQYALYLALPALILHSLIATPIRDMVGPDFLTFTMMSSLVFIGILWVLSWIFRLDARLRNTLILCGFFGNIAYIGFPYLASMIPGSEPLISIVVGIHVVLTFTIILYLLERGRNTHASLLYISKQLITHPLLLAVIAGLIISMTSFRVHSAFVDAIHMIALSASPVVLIALGTFIGHSLDRPKHPLHIALVSGAKLLLFPLVSIAIAMLWFDVSRLSVPLIESIMPVAITNFALADRYHLDKQTVAYAIIFSTIISFITIPLLTGVIM